MATFLATLVIFATAAAAMAVGILLQGRRLRGSCGGSGLECTCTVLAARSCEPLLSKPQGEGQRVSTLRIAVARPVI